MQLKKFNDYIKFSSKDPNNFKKQIVFTGKDPLGIFEEFNAGKSTEKPIIYWGESVGLHEGETREYIVPTIAQLSNKLEGSKYLAKQTANRSEVKNLKFPIIASSANTDSEFKTLGKFKKSRENFNVFKEKITPSTRFDIIGYKKRPIHIQERINSLGFDVDLNKFKYLVEVEDLLDSINSNFNLEFYHISLIESAGKVYLENLGNTLSLSPSQTVKMYEAAYWENYQSALPNWFKKSLFEEMIIPYYKKRYYDSLLIKPKNSIDFKKYCPDCK